MITNIKIRDLLIGFAIDYNLVQFQVQSDRFLLINSNFHIIIKK